MSQQLDPDALAAAVQAVEASVTKTISTMTVSEMGMSFNVGSKVTPAQVKDVAIPATAAGIQAYLDFLAAPGI